MAEQRSVELPKTWRPWGVRMVGGVLGIMLVVVCGAAWLSFPESVKEGFTWWQRVTTVGLIGLLFAAYYGLIRSRVVATEAGLTVVNGYKRRELPWAAIVAVHMPPGAPWATLDLADGETCSLLGIQSSDGASAKRAVRELRSLLPTS